ncbi:hypothetical protein E4G67_00190 [Candidatus Bathyarchaeota archaeon]|nr:MAG: hypothetical protein E4G67_00190 [Candidatus Bathyarchaeota archaeon]
MKTVRVFKTKDEEGNEFVYEFRRPSQSIISKAELVSRARYSEAFRAGVLVNAEVFKALRERGLWGDEQETESTALREKIASLEEKLRDEGLSNEDGLKLVDELRAARLEQQQHNSIVSNVTDSTCESIGNEERNMFYASACIFNKTTGQKVYKDLEDFKSRLNELSTVESYREATIASLEVLIGNELPSDLSTQYTENKWLAERNLLESEEEDEGTEEAETEGVELPKKTRKKRTTKVASS